MAKSARSGNYEEAQHLVVWSDPCTQWLLDHTKLRMVFAISQLPKINNGYPCSLQQSW